VFLAKPVQRALLLAAIRRWRLCRLVLQPAIHAFVRSILLGMSGRDGLRHDP
jgi:hypothetical protein